MLRPNTSSSRPCPARPAVLTTRGAQQGLDHLLLGVGYFDQTVGFSIPQTGIGMSRNLLSLLVFVVLLVLLNLILGDMDYGVHISIVGSLLLTLLVSFLMNAFTQRR